MNIACRGQLIALRNVGQLTGVYIGSIGSHGDFTLSRLLVVHDVPIVDADSLSITDLLDSDILLAALGDKEVAAFHHLIPFGHVLLQNAHVLDALGQEVVAASDELAVNGHKADVHDDVGVGLYLPELYQSPILNLHITQSGQFITLGDVGQSSGIDAVGIPIHNNRSVANNTLSFLIPVVDSDGLTFLFCGRSGKRRHRQQCQHHAQGQQC